MLSQGQYAKRKLKRIGNTRENIMEWIRNDVGEFAASFHKVDRRHVKDLLIRKVMRRWIRFKFIQNSADHDLFWTLGFNKDFNETNYKSINYKGPKNRI